VRAEPPLFAGLGTHSRRITTSSPDAQRYFNQGLAFMFGFNHDESVLAFRKASELDPACAMCEWGLAVARGPHINDPRVSDEHAREAVAALTRAREQSAKAATPVETALIDAAAKRYASPQPKDRAPLDRAYAEAMREVWAANPDDTDVGALFAEAMMDLRPWDFWTPRGAPQPGTDEIVKTLETVMAMAPQHPLANHLFIHLMEASRTPERAAAAADRLRDLQPGLGHMIHMPSHIDVRLGHWAAAIVANEKAIEADRRYREQRPRQGFYNLYMAHNRHLLTFAAMMTGQSARSIGTIREMVELMPDGWKKDSAALADGFVGMPFEVLMRFGRWDDILAAPEPPAYLPIARALRLYARGVALAATGKHAEARAERTTFLEAKAKVPSDAAFGNNPASALLAVAEAVLDGELAFLAGRQTAGIAQLRKAVAREDRLRYDEPPDWVQPVRHALGAALLKARRPGEAEAIYREDLARHPGNVWSLHGLARSLELQKTKAKAEEAAAARARLKAAAASADFPLSSSCACLPGV
jgi:tetratricopeptide (TPR) repeat protein